MGAHGPQALTEHHLLHRHLFMGCKPCQQPAPVGPLHVLQLPSWHVHLQWHRILHRLQCGCALVSPSMDCREMLAPPRTTEEMIFQHLEYFVLSSSSYLGAHRAVLSHGLLHSVFFLNKFLQRHRHYGYCAQLCLVLDLLEAAGSAMSGWGISSLLSQRPPLQSPHCQHLGT